MGPLNGLRVIEMAGMGPGPFCGMMLSDLGADVLRIEKPGAEIDTADPLCRNRFRLELDLKDKKQISILLNIVEKVDVIFEGFRPGVAERLGFGPDVCLERNRKIIYGRMTGWGQSGPLAKTAGHDINYIAISGALHAIGRKDDRPVPPLNLVGDFGGGGMLLTVGILSALFERNGSGKGQVVDAAMIDGSITMMAMLIGMQANGRNCNNVGEHFLSGAAHYYDTYETQDGKFLAVGPLEPHFYFEFISKTGLDPELFKNSDSTSENGQNPFFWQKLKPIIAKRIKTKTRDAWCRIFEGGDACVAPVLTLEEAPFYPHNEKRQAFVKVGGVLQNSPAPRFSRTPPGIPNIQKTEAEDVIGLLSNWGYSDSKVSSFIRRENGT